MQLVPQPCSRTTVTRESQAKVMITWLRFLSPTLTTTLTDKQVSERETISRGGGTHLKEDPPEKYVIPFLSTGGPSFSFYQHGGIVVPLRKIAFHTRYTGEIVIRGKTLHVAFGTAALGLTVISDSTCEALGGRQLVGGDMKVNLFDGFGSGVECQDTTIHVVSQDTTHVGGMISQKPAKIGLLNHHRIEGFNPSNTALGCAHFLFSSE